MLSFCMIASHLHLGTWSCCFPCLWLHGLRRRGRISCALAIIYGDELAFERSARAAAANLITLSDLSHFFESTQLYTQHFFLYLW